MKILPIRLLHSIGVVLTVVLCSTTSLANSAYITDKISVDIRSDKSAKGERIKSLPSGTTVEILARENNYAKVRTRDKVEGWIEAKYLTNEKPTQIEYLQLAVRYKEAQAKIEDYQTRLLQMQELRKEAKTADWLRNRLSENKKTEDRLNQDLKYKDIEIAELKISVANLEDQLINTKAELNNMLASSGAVSHKVAMSNDTAEQQIYSTSSSVSFYTWLVLSLAVTLIIGILMGFVLIDYKVRRKQGDARLY
jgi:SH3 domain protein